MIIITQGFIPSSDFSILVSLFCLPLSRVWQALRHSPSTYSLWVISCISYLLTSFVIFSTYLTSPSSTSFVLSCSTILSASLYSLTSNYSSQCSISALSLSRFYVRSHSSSFCSKESMALSPIRVWLGRSIIYPSLFSLAYASSIQWVSWLKRLKEV